MTNTFSAQTGSVSHGLPGKKNAFSEYQFVYEYSPIGVLRVDPRKVILSANRRFVQIFGYDHPEDVVGKSTRILFPSYEIFEAVETRLFPAMLNDGVATDELEMVKRDGTTFWCRINGRMIERDNFERCAVWIYEDVTQTRELLESTRRSLRELQDAQEQLILSEKMAALGRLVAGITHEVNTPIGVSVTAASSLVSRSRDFKVEYQSGQVKKKSDLERYIDYCMQSGDILLNNLQRAADLIQSFKRVAVDQSTEEIRSFELVPYIRDILRSLHPQYRNRPIRIETVGDEKLIIESCPGIFAQVITNLLNNALLHAFDEKDDGAITIDVRAIDSQQIQVSFADNGKGIAADVLPHIYEPFFTTRHGSGGTGLGLHLVFNLLQKKLKGSIDCQSKPGVGTRFILNLPARIA